VYPDRLAGLGGDDPHLRSAHALSRCRVSVEGSAIGRVADFLIETDAWGIRYLVLRSAHRTGQRHTLLAPGWVAAIEWDARLIVLDLPRLAVLQAPGYDRRQRVDRAYEARLYSHYGSDRSRAPLLHPRAQAQLGAGGDVAALGVRVAPLMLEAARQLGLAERCGVVVREVREGGPAGNADIRPGDVIVGADRHPVTSASDLCRVVESHADRTPLPLHVRRSGYTVYTVVKLS